MVLLSILFVSLTLAAAQSGSPTPPRAVPTPITENYHGIEIADVYRGLEDTTSDETRAWVKAQDTFTRQFVQRLPGLKTAATRVGQYPPAETVGPPQIAGGRVFVGVRKGTSPVALVELLPEGDRRELLTMPAVEQVGSWSIAPTANRVAHIDVVDGAGVWRIVDLESRERLDALTGLAPSPIVLAWALDGTAVFYVSAGPDGARVVRRHRIGQPQSVDPIVFSSPDPGAALRIVMADDGRFLTIGVLPFGRVHTRMFWLPADAETARELFAGHIGAYQFLGNDNSTAYFRTTHTAPNGRIVAVDLSRPAPRQWRTIINEGPQAIMTANLVGDRFVLTYSRDAQATIKVFSLTGRPERSAELPAIGMTWLAASATPGMIGSRDSPVAFYQFLTANRQVTGYRFDASTGESRVVQETKRSIRSDEYVLRHITYRSRDGARVPMFLAHRKNLPRDGTHPVIFDAVGTGGVTALSFWSPNTFLFMEVGGIYAFAGIRGGDDYGERWHFAGAGHNRPRSVDDYIAGLEWLIAEDYTRAGNIAAIAAGASTAVVAAAINRRPELLGAAALGSPVLDVLRAAVLPGGASWHEEIGRVERRQDAEIARSWSPYANIKKACYPALYVVANEKDSVAHPSHAYKYVAAVQAAQTCARPVLLEVRWGQGFTTFGANAAEQVAFFMQALGIPAARVPDGS